MIHVERVSIRTGQDARVQIDVRTADLTVRVTADGAATTELQGTVRVLLGAAVPPPEIAAGETAEWPTRHAPLRGEPVIVRDVALGPAIVVVDLADRAPVWSAIVVEAAAPNLVELRVGPRIRPR